MESTKYARTMSIDAWSDFAGTTQSRIVDLIVTNLFTVCAVAGAVVRYVAAASAVFWLGAALGVGSVSMLGRLLRRDISRDGTLLATDQAARMIVLLVSAACYLPRRPNDAAWIWIATGLAILAILTEPT